MRTWKYKRGYLRRGRKVQGHRQRYQRKRFLVDYNPLKHKSILERYDAEGELEGPSDTNAALKIIIGKQQSLGDEMNGVKLILKNNEIVGSTKVNPIDNPKFPKNTFVLSKLFIKKSSRGKGIGTEVLENIFKNKNVNLLVFGVEPTAEQFYMNKGAKYLPGAKVATGEKVMYMTRDPNAELLFAPRPNKLETKQEV